MESDEAKIIQQRMFARLNARDRGVPRRSTNTLASRSADIHLEDTTRLPVAQRTQELQNASGQFYFIVGYSKVGGPDVAA